MVQRPQRSPVGEMDGAIVTLLTDETTGLETLQRGVLQILHANLNTELAVQELAWMSKDAAFAASMNQVPIVISLEHIQDANFWSGHKPSLITRGPDYFPSLTVMAYGSAGGGDIGIDQAYGVADRVAVETLVKAGFYPDDDITGIGESIVNSRIQRTTDAVLSVLAHNRTIGGLVAHITETPQVLVSEVFAVTDDRSGRWYWQGSRIDLTLTRVSQVYG